MTDELTDNKAGFTTIYIVSFSVAVENNLHNRLMS